MPDRAPAPSTSNPPRSTATTPASRPADASVSLPADRSEREHPAPGRPASTNKRATELRARVADLEAELRELDRDPTAHHLRLGEDQLEEIAHRAARILRNELRPVTEAPRDPHPTPSRDTIRPVNEHWYFRPIGRR